MDSGGGSSSLCPWTVNVQYFNIHVLIPPSTALIKYFAALTYRIDRRRGFYLFPHGGVFHRPQVRLLLGWQIGGFMRNICTCNVHLWHNLQWWDANLCRARNVQNRAVLELWLACWCLELTKREMKLCFKTWDPSLAAYLSHFQYRRAQGRDYC